MIVMAYVCLVVLILLLLVATISLASDDNGSGTLGGAIMTMLAVLALIGVIAR